MIKFLDYTGLSYLWSKIKSFIPSLSKKSQSIPFGQVDSTSTSTVYTATIDGIDELRDGVCCYLRNGVVNSAEGYTININNLGAKPVYTTYDGARSTVGFYSNKTYLFVYNSTRVSGGCWDVYYGYYQDSDDTKVDKVSTTTDNAVVRFDGTAGNIQNSGVLIDDSNNLSAPGDIRAKGNDIYFGTASGSQCHMQYDNTDKCLKFIFD